MSPLDVLLLLFSLRALASPLSIRSVPSFVFDGDAPFSVDAGTLAASLTCPNGHPTSSSPPVLLVHGTSTTGEETWANGYVPALLANGFTACYVTLPNRAMGDMQVSAEYVAYNLHYLSSLSGGLHPAVIAHSQGNPDTQWALRFWPSTAAVTRAFVSLAPDFTGIDMFNSDLSAICSDGDLCQASLWQQSAGSHYYNALRNEEFKAIVPTTALWTEFDEVVRPSDTNAELPGATVLSVQDLCPARLVDHMLMTTDAAAFALALDALKNNGIASLSRVREDLFSICFRMSAPNMSSSVVRALEDTWQDLLKGFILGSTRLASEPPVLAYALP